jgi:hypothetical protein
VKIWKLASSISKVFEKGGKQRHRFRTSHKPAFPRPTVVAIIHAAIFVNPSPQPCSNRIEPT